MWYAMNKVAGSSMLWCGLIALAVLYGPSKIDAFGPPVKTLVASGVIIAAAVAVMVITTVLSPRA
jgi:membrane associated rhomboid family serine protease